MFFCEVLSNFCLLLATSGPASRFTLTKKQSILWCDCISLLCSIFIPISDLMTERSPCNFRKYSLIDPVANYEFSKDKV